MRKLHLLLLSFLLLPLASSAYVEDLTPVSHWTCDEVSGTRSDSNTVTANDLTDINTVLYSAGKLENACDFEDANAEKLSGTNEYDNTAGSISFWFKIENLKTSGYSPIFLSNNLNTSSNGVSVRYNYTDAKTYVSIGTGAEYITGVTALTAGTWYHMVVVWDTSNGYVYLNGADDTNTTSAPFTVGNGDSNFYIGTGAYYSTRYYDGLIDEVSIFDYALTSGNVTTLYNSGTPLAYSSGESGTSTATTSTSVDPIGNIDIVFMLAFILFFIILITLGMFFKVTKSKHLWN